MVDKKAVEARTRLLMRDWLTTPKKYEQVREEYEALLECLDQYHAFMNEREVERYNDRGVEHFTTNVTARMGEIRRRSMALAEADDHGDLKDLAVNFVAESVTRDERDLERITEVFTGGGIPHLQRQGWDAQFAGKSYANAMNIAGFVLPLYRSGDYQAERAFIRSTQGMPRDLPPRGYKLHVSIHPLSMENARDRLLPFLKHSDYMYKIVADPSDLAGGQRGKVVTIYPKTREEATSEDGFAPLVQAIEDRAGAWSLIAGPPVTGEDRMGELRLVYREENAKYLG